MNSIKYVIICCVLNVAVMCGMDRPLVCWPQGLPTAKQLIDNDGAQLKELLKLDAQGYCSPKIEQAGAILQKASMPIIQMLRNKDVTKMAFLVAQRSESQQRLLKLLRKNKFDKASSLLEENPYVLYTYQDDYKFSAINDLFIRKLLTISPDSFHYISLKKMVHYGFDLDVRDTEGTPLLCSAIVCKGNMFLDLLKAGVKVDAKDQDGDTALSYAVASKDKYKIAALLHYGAAINAPIFKYVAEESPKSRLLYNQIYDAFQQQNCIYCELHGCDLLQIPCINRHLEHFICEDCYESNGAGNPCPLCSCTLGEL